MMHKFFCLSGINLIKKGVWKNFSRFMGQDCNFISIINIFLECLFFFFLVAVYKPNGFNQLVNIGAFLLPMSLRIEVDFLVHQDSE